jgi:hypothetical protein
MYIYLVILVILIYFYSTNIETFNNYIFNYPSRSFCPTRNMSYDLRCEPKIPITENVYYNASVISHPDCDKIPKKCLNI